MAEMDMLFAEIFEGKKRIIQQIKHEADLFDNHLASPHCLLPPSPVSSDLNELKKEQISGLLLQRSQSANPHFSSHNSLGQEPIVTDRNKGLPNALCTEAYASNNGTDAGDRLSVLPPFPIDDTQCTVKDVPELDGSVTSPPPGCADERIPDNCQDPAQSLVKIQRSKSRQRALELRNSAKANKVKSCEENTAGSHTSQKTQSRINPLQYDHFDSLNMSSNCPLPPPGCAIGLLESFDFSVLADSSSGAETNLVDCRGNKKNSIVCYDKMAQSRTSITQASVAEVVDGDKRALEKSAKHSSCNNELLKSLPVISNKSYKERKANRSDVGVKGKDSLSHLSSGSPHSLSVAGTGQNIPTYEGYFVQSDAEIPCTTNEGINFDKLDLPPTALRRASVPDQFCKSINMCTPLSHSTAYESHEALGGDGLRIGKGSVHSRFSKPKLSEKAGLRKGEPSLSEKESKRSNIVSKMSSFVPLVQQKQAAAVITGKRAIKVKSLEAAEAAKRLCRKGE